MKRMVAALVLVLALAGCAVTGQPARPGVAATFDGRTVTNDEVAEWVGAFNALHAPADPSAVVTMLLLKPTLDKAAAEAGILYSDDELNFEARKWIASQSGEQVDITPQMREAVREVRTLVALINGQGTATQVAETLQKIEADAIASPMYGTFTLAQYTESLKAAYTRQQDAGNLGDVNYLVFKDVTGFAPVAQQPWMVNEPPAKGATPDATGATPAPTPAS